MKFFVKSLLLLVATLILVPASFVTATPPSAAVAIPAFNPKRHVLGHLGLFAVLNLTQIALNGMPAQAGHSATQQPATKGPKKKLTFKQHVAHAATTSKAFAKALANWKSYQAYGSELKAVVWPAATKSLKKRTPAQWTKEVLERMKTFATTHQVVCFGVAAQLVLGSTYAWHCSNAHNKGVVAKEKADADAEIERKRVAAEVAAKALADRDAGMLALQARAQNVGLTAHADESVVDFTRRIQEAETKKTNAQSRWQKGLKKLNFKTAKEKATARLAAYETERLAAEALRVKQAAARLQQQQKEREQELLQELAALRQLAAQYLTPDERAAALLLSRHQKPKPSDIPDDVEEAEILAELAQQKAASAGTGATVLRRQHEAEAQHLEKERAAQATTERARLAKSTAKDDSVRSKKPHSSLTLRALDDTATPLTEEQRNNQEAVRRSHNEVAQIKQARVAAEQERQRQADEIHARLLRAAPPEGQDSRLVVYTQPTTNDDSLAARHQPAAANGETTYDADLDEAAGHGTAGAGAATQPVTPQRAPAATVDTASSSNDSEAPPAVITQTTPAAQASEVTAPATTPLTVAKAARLYMDAYVTPLTKLLHLTKRAPGTPAHATDSVANRHTPPAAYESTEAPPAAQDETNDDTDLDEVDNPPATLEEALDGSKDARYFPLDVYAKTDPSFFIEGDAFFRQTGTDAQGNPIYVWFTYSTATHGYDESHLRLTKKPSGVPKDLKEAARLESYTTAAATHPKKGLSNLWGFWA